MPDRQPQVVVPVRIGPLTAAVIVVVLLACKMMVLLVWAVFIILAAVVVVAVFGAERLHDIFLGRGGCYRPPCDGDR